MTYAARPVARQHTPPHVAPARRATVWSLAAATGFGTPPLRALHAAARAAFAMPAITAMLFDTATPSILVTERACATCHDARRRASATLAAEILHASSNSGHYFGRRAINAARPPARPRQMMRCRFSRFASYGPSSFIIIGRRYAAHVAAMRRSDIIITPFSPMIRAHYAAQQCFLSSILFINKMPPYQGASHSAHDAPLPPTATRARGSFARRVPGEMRKPFNAG